MKTQLFHRDILLPWCALEPLLVAQEFQLHYTHHAMLGCVHDKYGPIMHPPKTVRVTRDNIIEAETSGKNVIKVLVRIPYNEGFDLMLALGDFSNVSATVKTCWLNRVADTHRTLDRSKYEQHV